MSTQIHLTQVLHTLTFQGGTSEKNTFYIVDHILTYNWTFYPKTIYFDIIISYPQDVMKYLLAQGDHSTKSVNLTNDLIRVLWGQILIQFRSQKT